MKSILLALSILFFCMNCYCKTNHDFFLFDTIFHEWTIAFNNKNLDKTCNLFSKTVTANYQGIPQKNYASICNGFKKIFSDPNQIYRYNYKLHQIYLANDLAAIRITWYLKIYKDKKEISATQDEGIDIFKRNSNDIWQIENYLAYKSA